MTPSTYKFRAKEIDEGVLGDWVYGSLVWLPSSGVALIVPENTDSAWVGEDSIYVAPETVGAYRGQSWDGKTIADLYDGDIVTREGLGGEEYMLLIEPLIHLPDRAKDLTIIGNKHDNPILLRDPQPYLFSRITIMTSTLKDMSRIDLEWYIEKRERRIAMLREDFETFGAAQEDLETFAQLHDEVDQAKAYLLPLLTKDHE